MSRSSSTSPLASFGRRPFIHGLVEVMSRVSISATMPRHCVSTCAGKRIYRGILRSASPWILRPQGSSVCSILTSAQIATSRTSASSFRVCSFNSSSVREPKKRFPRTVSTPVRAVRSSWRKCPRSCEGSCAKSRQRPGRHKSFLRRRQRLRNVASA